MRPKAQQKEKCINISSFHFAPEMLLFFLMGMIYLESGSQKMDRGQYNMHVEVWDK